jgi:S-adenosylmethionine:tRNA ribosyltransferase-isomerase
MSLLVTARTDFSLPDELNATEPPEMRGIARDGIRLLVSDRTGLQHALFREVNRFLRPGDVVVVNTSATIPAAVQGCRRGEPIGVHFSSPHPIGGWVVEMRAPDNSGPLRDGRAGDIVALPGDAGLRIVDSYPEGGRIGGRLWRAELVAPDPVLDYLAEHGRPITYGYVRRTWPLSTYQTVFAREPGSAEMPSAGRPFSHRLVTRLIAEGVAFAPVILHAAVSSLESGELPIPERFEVPEATARLIHHTRSTGGRVIAVGTTVTRALESVARPDGTVVAGKGWTDVVLGPGRPVRAIDGLVTGWHPPKASHLALLEAVAGWESLQRAYDAALEAGYLWHEFGDSCLLWRGFY